MLYQIFVEPFVNLLEILYLGIVSVTSDYGVSLLILSVVTSVLIFILNRLLSVYPKRERQIQQILNPQIEKIKSESKGEERHERIKRLYKRYSYNPIYLIRSSIPLLLQLPFLIGAYFMLMNLELLENESFLTIQDLSRPDGLFLGLNVLPFLMTFINLGTVYLSKQLTPKGRIQAIFIALLFLILLYNATSALLIFWTMNNVFFLLQVLISRRKDAVTISDQLSEKINEQYLSSQNRVLILLKSEKFIQVITIYFSSLILFYLLVSLSDFGVSEKQFFNRPQKILPFLAAAIIWFALSLYHLHKRYRSNKIYYISNTIAVAVFGITIGLLINHIRPFSIFESGTNLLMVLLAFIFTISGFILNGLGFIVNKREVMKINAKWYWGLLLLPLIPGFHLAGSNTDYLNDGYYLLYFFILLIITLFSYGWALLTFPASVDRRKSITFISTFIFLFLSLPIIRAMLSLTNRIDLDFWIILSVVYSALFLIPMEKYKSFAFSVVVVLTSFNAVTFLYKANTDDRFSHSEITSLPNEIEELDFVHTPNIYLFVYDGIPNQRVFEELDLPFDRLNQLLSENDFKLYDDTYTLHSASIQSMAKLLNVTGESLTDAESRNIYSGNSVVNVKLRKHGYKTYKLLNNHYTGAFAFHNQHLVDEFYPPKTVNSVNYDFFVTLMRGILQGELQFNTKGLIIEEYNEQAVQQRKNEIIRLPKEKTFVLNHYPFPGHSQNSGRLLPNETEIWIENLSFALDQMEEDLESIINYDPDAIVIFVGDHGPYLTGDGYILRNVRTSDITPTMIWDRIGTMIAIRWPDQEIAQKYDQQLTLNQDIFAVVFSYMSETPKPTDLQPDRTFTGFRALSRPMGTVFKEGEILNH